MTDKRVLIILGAVVCMTALLCRPAQAEFEISPGINYTFGAITVSRSQIPQSGFPWVPSEGSAYSDISEVDPYNEIKFPLDIAMASLDLQYRNNDWELSVSYQHNINDPTKRIQGDEYGPESWTAEDGWSAVGNVTGVTTWSHTDLDAWIIDAKFRYTFYSTAHSADSETWSTNLFIGLGYSFKQYEYDGSLSTVDSTVGDYWRYAESDPGIDYKTKLSIPYFELGGSGSHNNISVEAGFGYSPIVNIKDTQDNRLMRIPGPFTADGDCKGRAFMAGMQISYYFTQHWALKTALDYTDIRAEGTQTTHQSSGYITTPAFVSWAETTFDNAEEITSQQTSISLKIDYQF